MSINNPYNLGNYDRILVEDDIQQYDLNHTIIRSIRFPLVLNQRWDNIPPCNYEDVMWQNLVDYTSDSVTPNIGVAVTQSIEFKKIHDDPLILTKWVGKINNEGNIEFAILLGTGNTATKTSHDPILSGSNESGVSIATSLGIGAPCPQEIEENRIAVIDNKLCYNDGNGYREILLGERIEPTT